MFCTILTSIGLYAQNTPIYVNQAANGAANGQSWTDAFTDLHSALALAQSGDEIWVAQGVYRPSENGERLAFYELKSGVGLYGGFAGTETSLNQRNWLNHPTVLSGDIGIPGDSTDNSYNLLFLDNPDSSTVVDGLILRDAVANNLNTFNFGERGNSGGALYLEATNGEAYAEIRNCSFEHNYAYAHGAAVYVNGGPGSSVAPRFLNCIFRQNHARRDGGAVARDGGSWVERAPDFGYCRFENNRAGRNGGGLWFRDSDGVDTLNVTGCVFSGNYATSFGGAVDILTGRTGGSRLVIDSCMVEKNRAGAEGGALRLWYKASFASAVFARIANSHWIENGDSSTINIVYSGIIGPNGEGGLLLVEDCLFERNKSNRQMLFLSEVEQVVLRKCVFKNNKLKGSSTNFREIINLSGLSKNQLESCMFDKNEGENGDILLYKNTLPHKSTLLNCMFFNNKNIAFPYLQYSNSQFNFTPINCLFYQNQGTYSNLGSGKVDFYNCAFYQDTDPTELFASFTSVHLNHCYVENLDCAALPKVNCTNLITGVDPLFVNPDSGDFRLQACSPLLDAGLNLSTDTIPFDIAGNPRIQRLATDIGPYELPPPGLGAEPEASPSCPGGASGALAFQVENGCEPLHYSWLSGAGATGQLLSGLAPGLYNFTITDATGASFTASASVPTGNGPELSPLAQTLLCGDTLGGSTTATLSSGALPYTFLWAGGNTDSLRTGLPAGAYPLTVTDANGCTATGMVEVDKMGSLSVDIEVGEISCFGQADGSFTVLPANGKAPYTWKWENGATSPTLAPLGPGSYLGTLTDALGCTIVWILPLNEPEELILDALVTNATDSSLTNGSIQLLPAGGTEPYTALWDHGASGLTLTNLAQGVYSVTLMDTNGCSVARDFFVGVSTQTAPQLTTGFECQVYPNPAQAEVILSGRLPQIAPLRWTLFDAAGQLVRHLDWQPPAAQFGFVLQLEGLPAGLYVWKAEAGGWRRNGRLVKL